MSVLHVLTLSVKVGANDIYLRKWTTNQEMIFDSQLGYCFMASKGNHPTLLGQGVAQVGLWI